MKEKYTIEQEVYLRTDPEQFKRLVTGILKRQNTIIYYVVCGTDETAHYEFELTTEKSLMIQFN